MTDEGGKAVKIRGLDPHPVNKGRLCPKEANALDIIYAQDRLEQPLKRHNGSFQEITWSQALDEITGKLTQLKRDYSPQVLGFFCGSIGVENLEMSTSVNLAPFGPGNAQLLLVGEYTLTLHKLWPRNCQGISY